MAYHRTGHSEHHQQLAFSSTWWTRSHHRSHSNAVRKPSYCRAFWISDSKRSIHRSSPAAAEDDVDALLETLGQMHKDVDSSLSTSRKQAVERHNAKTHVIPYKPTVGDFVVVARTQGPRTQDVYQLDWSPAVFRAIPLRLHCRARASPHGHHCRCSRLPHQAVPPTLGWNQGAVMKR